jgi:hypothetical protein
MATYIVVLEIETDPTEKAPSRWNWAELLDTPHRAACIKEIQVEDAPSDAQYELFRDLTDDYANAVRQEVGYYDNEEAE